MLASLLYLLKSHSIQRTPQITLKRRIEEWFVLSSALRFELKPKPCTRETNSCAYMCTQGAIRPRDSTSTLLTENKEVVPHILVVRTSGPFDPVIIPMVSHIFLYE